MTLADRWRNVVLVARGCYLREDEAFVHQGSAISPGVEEYDVTQDITCARDDLASLNPARI